MLQTNMYLRLWLSIPKFWRRKFIGYTQLQRSPASEKNSKAWLGVARKLLMPAWPSGRRWTKSSPGDSRSTRRASWQFLSLFSINWMLVTWYFLTRKQVSALLLGGNVTDNHTEQFHITWITESKLYLFQLHFSNYRGLLFLDYCRKGRAHHRRQY